MYTLLLLSSAFVPAQEPAVESVRVDGIFLPPVGARAPFHVLQGLPLSPNDSTVVSSQQSQVGDDGTFTVQWPATGIRRGQTIIPVRIFDAYGGIAFAGFYVAPRDDEPVVFDGTRQRHALHGQVMVDGQAPPGRIALAAGDDDERQHIAAVASPGGSFTIVVRTEDLVNCAATALALEVGIPAQRPGSSHACRIPIGGAHRLLCAREVHLQPTKLESTTVNIELPEAPAGVPFFAQSEDGETRTAGHTSEDHTVELVSVGTRKPIRCEAFTTDCTLRYDIDVRGEAVLVEQRPHRHWSGTLRSSDGTPVPGAAITPRLAGGVEMLIAALAGPGAARSAADGSFALLAPDRACRGLEVRLDRRRTVLDAAFGATPLTLPATGVLSLRSLRFTTGVPTHAIADGIRLVLARRDGWRHSLVARKLPWPVFDLPPGEYVFCASAAPAYFQVGGFAVHADETTAVDLSLAPGRVFDGEVHGADGGRVLVRGTDRSGLPYLWTISEPSGRFAFAVPAHVASVEVVASTFGSPAARATAILEGDSVAPIVLE